MNALPLLLPLVIIVFGGIPILLLTRRAMRARLATARPRALAGWWLLAALPWAAVWTWVLRDGRFTIDVASTTDVVRAVAAVVLVLLVLVSLPAAVVTATCVRLRGTDADRPGPRDAP